jgi:3-deoxy-D-manno-octulosonic-acid transferase
VQNSEALGQGVTTLLQQPERRQALGEAAYQVLRDNQGAITRTVGLIEQGLSQQMQV